MAGVGKAADAVADAPATAGLEATAENGAVGGAMYGRCRGDAAPESSGVVVAVVAGGATKRGAESTGVAAPTAPVSNGEDTAYNGCPSEERIGLAYPLADGGACDATTTSRGDVQWKRGAWPTTLGDNCARAPGAKADGARMDGRNGEGSVRTHACGEPQQPKPTEVHGDDPAGRGVAAPQGADGGCGVAVVTRGVTTTAGRPVAFAQEMAWALARRSASSTERRWSAGGNSAALGGMSD
mmetsp:Transcript_73994/g.214105  ORF Transcript_73994/g.214105 Transcript_73994/m.214105 type:complete len:240 (-) Transcript_73994:666-1385(-)